MTHLLHVVSLYAQRARGLSAIAKFLVNKLRITKYVGDVLLEKSGVLTQVKDLLTKLLENRPENIVEFIAE